MLEELEKSLSGGASYTSSYFYHFPLAFCDVPHVLFLVVLSFPTEVVQDKAEEREVSSLHKAKEDIVQADIPFD